MMVSRQRTEVEAARFKSELYCLRGQLLLSSNGVVIADKSNFPSMFTKCNKQVE